MIHCSDEEAPAGVCRNTGMLKGLMDTAAEFSRAVELQNAKRFAEAAAIYRAVARQTLTVNLALNLGQCALEVGGLDEAEHWFALAHQHKPTDKMVLRQLGGLRLVEGKPEEAVALLRAALAADPADAMSEVVLAEALLSIGAFDEGWPLLEARTRAWARPSPPAAFPEWRGEPLTGRHIVVVAEQGLGDQIQFIRFASHLKAAGARRVTVTCWAPLKRLFATAPCVDEVVAWPPGQLSELPPADVWVRYMSVPHRLGLGEADFAPQPYLSVSSRAGAGRIGVAPSGAAIHNYDHHRSLDAQSADRLLKLPGAMDLRPEATGCADMLETAEIVAGLDLVISVDTSIAHLAGALGKPVWVLLPALGTDWRWMRGREDSPWYASVRLFRQDRPHTWGAVIDRISSLI